MQGRAGTQPWAHLFQTARPVSVDCLTSQLLIKRHFGWLPCWLALLPLQVMLHFQKMQLWGQLPSAAGKPGLISAWVDGHEIVASLRDELVGR